MRISTNERAYHQNVSFNARRMLNIAFNKQLRNYISYVLVIMNEYTAILFRWLIPFSYVKEHIDKIMKSYIILKSAYKELTVIMNLCLL